MGRLIDADALIAHLTDWRKNWEESENSYEKAWTLTAIDYFTNLVNGKKIAYDVEAVVAELEDASVCDDTDDAFFIRESKAIEIVRNGGKE